MKESRARVLLSQHSSVAQKVYAAIPIQDEWSVKAVCSELVRNGFSHDIRTVNGCINSLIASGLVVEKVAGKYQRAPIKQEVEPLSTTKNEATAAKAAPAIDRLCDLSGKFMHLVSSMKAVADELETVALEVAEQIKRGSEDAEKFKQLQQLLKSIGG